MKIKNAFLFLFGVIFLTIGFSYLLNATLGITGLVISEETTTTENGFIGVLFTLGGFFVLSRIRKKRGQAAMEFLITYGWAILAAIIVIGIVGVFFSPRAQLSPACVLSPPFYCVASEAAVVADLQTGQSGVAIEVRNNGNTIIQDPIPEIITPQGISCSGSSGYVQTIPAGGTAVLLGLCDTQLVEGEDFNAEITITYTTSGSQLERTSTGTMYAKVRLTCSSC